MFTWKIIEVVANFIRYVHVSLLYFRCLTFLAHECQHRIFHWDSNLFVNPKYFTLRITDLALRNGIVKFAYYQHLCVWFCIILCVWVNHLVFFPPVVCCIVICFIENIRTSHLSLSLYQKKTKLMDDSKLRVIEQPIYWYRKL